MYLFPMAFATRLTTTDFKRSFTKIFTNKTRYCHRILSSFYRKRSDQNRLCEGGNRSENEREKSRNGKGNEFQLMLKPKTAKETGQIDIRWYKSEK